MEVKARPVLVTSSGHVLGATSTTKPAPQGKGLIIAVLAFMGLACLLLGMYESSKTSDEAHVVVQSSANVTT